MIEPEMQDGETVFVWVENDIGNIGPWRGKVIRQKKEWVEIDHFWSNGGSFITDESSTIKWTHTKPLTSSEQQKQPIVKG